MTLQTWIICEPHLDDPTYDDDVSWVRQGMAGMEVEAPTQKPTQRELREDD